MPRKPAKTSTTIAPAAKTSTRQKKVARTTMCVHRIPADSYCKKGCDD